jgi:hypothetical protein
MICRACDYSDLETATNHGAHKSRDIFLWAEA